MIPTEQEEKAAVIRKAAEVAGLRSCHVTHARHRHLVLADPELVKFRDLEKQLKELEEVLYVMAKQSLAVRAQLYQLAVQTLGPEKD